MSKKQWLKICEKPTSGEDRKGPAPEKQIKGDTSSDIKDKYLSVTKGKNIVW